MKEYFLSIIVEILDTYLKILGMYDIYSNKSINEKYQIVTKMKQFDIEGMANDCNTKDEQVNLLYKIFWYTRKYRSNIKCAITVKKDYLEIWIDDVMIKFIYNGDNMDIDYISLDNSFITTLINVHFKLNVKYQPVNAIYNILTWKSDDENIAVVDNSGHVTTVGEGVTSISVTASNGKQAICVVTVTPDMEKISHKIEIIENDIVNINGRLDELFWTVPSEETLFMKND